MQRVHVDRVDLDLTAPLVPLLVERHVLRAAADASLTQPAMSRALQRLRLLSDDPLLNRDERAFGCSRRADDLYDQLEMITPHLERSWTRADLDPGRSERADPTPGCDYAGRTPLPISSASLNPLHAYYIDPPAHCAGTPQAGHDRLRTRTSASLHFLVALRRAVSRREMFSTFGIDLVRAVHGNLALIGESTPVITTKRIMERSGGWRSTNPPITRFGKNLRSQAHPDIHHRYRAVAITGSVRHGTRINARGDGNNRIRRRDYEHSHSAHVLNNIGVSDRDRARSRAIDDQDTTQARAKICCTPS